MTRYRLPALVALVTLTVSGVASAGPIGYVQTNLTSDLPGAANLDPLLKNPWGMSFGLNSPFWNSDQMTDVSTLYNAAGAPQALVVATPPAPGAGPTGPTGQVFLGGMGFTTKANATAVFAFATLAGTIDAWNSGPNAVTQFTTSDGAVYTGLAVAGQRLYAADSKNGTIDVFNNSFNPTTVSGSFIDPSVPAGFTPYNIQNIGGALYVEYSKRNAPGGYIGVFDANGVLQQHISDAHLNAPWGVTLAPAGFGQFGSDLLVGNFGTGFIDAFDPTTDAFLGVLSDANGNPIINSGLWALAFRAPGSNFDSNALFFTAGINGERDGLFGEIQATAVPEPMTLSMVGMGVVAIAHRMRRGRRS